MTIRKRGSVPNVVRAREEGAAARSGRASKLQQQRKGTTGSALNDTVSGAFRGPKRRNS
jgi:hypothetical protein